MSWFANVGCSAIANIPIVDVEDVGKQRVLKGYSFVLSASAATSALAIGSCLIQYGNSTASLTSTAVVGYGSSVSNVTVTGNCHIPARAFRGTMGAGSSVCNPVSISLWGDWA